jgi:sarcosine oxidase subunit delta
MRIECPYCGERDAQEFVYRGDAGPRRPDSEAGIYEYVYERDNLAGPMAEHWYHAQGCRTWIRVRRDTRTHAMLGSAFAWEDGQ